MGDSTFETLEEEVLYTASALVADDDARDLLPATASWMGRIDEARLADRGVRAEAMAAEAQRQVANQRLDDSCRAFGDELYLACSKDRESARWKQFFAEAVSKFVRKALAAQVLTVQGWLTSSDEVLLRHKAGLERWVGVADAALVRDRALSLRRGENWERRKGLCAALTRERDALHAALVRRAVERKLSRGWPDTFFRVSTRSAREGEEGEGSPDAEVAPG